MHLKKERSVSSFMVAFLTRKCFDTKQMCKTWHIEFSCDVQMAPLAGICVLDLFLTCEI